MLSPTYYFFPPLTLLSFFPPPVRGAKAKKIYYYKKKNLFKENLFVELVVQQLKFHLMILLVQYDLLIHQIQSI